MGLLPNARYSPRLAAAIARLGATVPFRDAAALLADLLGVTAHEATLRRYTYQAGEAALAEEETALRRVLAAAPPGPAAPPCPLVSLDATKVPLVGGQWTDAKLAAFGEVVPGPPDDAGRPTATTARVSYAARWEPAEAFGATITLEAHRRGLLGAPTVVSPNDGAEWIQRNLDLVVPQAVRILDFPHAVEHLGAVAALVYGGEGAEAVAWVAAQRRALLASGPGPLLAALAACRERGPCATARPTADGQSPEEQLAREVAYFARRAGQLDYPAFRAAGYPIGSGCVESGHRVVIAARLKLAGQHWAARHLNPLLVLRATLCNDRWAAAWPATWGRWRDRVAARRALARQQRRATHAPPPTPVPLPPPAAPPPAASAPPRPKLVVDGRPTAAHPWRRPFLPRRAAS